ncbi:general transcription factor II-I repeat domain-containing protein 2-like [Ranitomeya variabilis]|uniref:general transcription factor II-I repeat domain-containing protein 2-like n=1 Tax=Ranitomeya variabilis TaxID=490064 RepID=UPI004055CE19
MANVPPTMRKRKLIEERRVFQEKWESQYFCLTVGGKIHCLICNSCIATPKEYNLKRHYETNHRVYDKFEGPMRVSKLKELKANLTQQQTCFTKIQKGTVASVSASYKLSKMIAVNGKSYSEVDFIKQCLVKTAEIVCPEKAQLFKDISLTRNTVAERIDEMSVDVKQQLKAVSSRFEHFSIAIDESVDVSGIAQLAIFIRACDSEFKICEELLELVPMYDTTTSENIFEKVDQVLFEYGFDLCKLNLCSKILKLDHVLSLVTKTVKFIRGRALNHRQFSQLLEDMDNQFTDVPFYTEIRWLSCHRVLKRFYLLRQEIVMFLEMKGQNTDEITDKGWLQDLAFAVDITAHLTDLSLKLKGKNKLITNQYDDIKCFLAKLSLWKSQLSNENLVHFPTCKELKTQLILSLYLSLLNMTVI